MNQALARNIERAMEARGMNPASLARAARINPTGVYDILSGKSASPKVETVEKLARALNVPFALLFETQAEIDLRNELLTVAAQLPPHEQRRLLAAARAWLAEPDGPSQEGEQAGTP